jgi:hypothetical protein
MGVYIVEVSIILYIQAGKANIYLVPLSCGNHMRTTIHKARLPTIILVGKPQVRSRRQALVLLRGHQKSMKASENGTVPSN